MPCTTLHVPSFGSRRSHGAFVASNLLPCIPKSQVGLQGLEAGLDKFEPRRGGRLTTTVYWCAPAANPFNPASRTAGGHAGSSQAAVGAAWLWSHQTHVPATYVPVAAQPAGRHSHARCIGSKAVVKKRQWNVTCELNACACRRCGLC
jgi:hypothetical protein